MERCPRCLLPESFPGIVLRPGGQCSICDEAFAVEETSAALVTTEKARLKREMDDLIVASRGRAAYDCMVYFSGGKDSSYLVLLMKEVYGLNVLAFTCENEFLSPVARKNVEQLTRALNVDHVWGAPPASLLRKIYKTRLLEASHCGASCVDTVCESCFNVTMLTGLRVAFEQGIPLLVNGLSPAQNNFELRYRDSDEALAGMIQLSECDPGALFGVVPTEEEARALSIPHWADGSLPVMLYPFNVMEYDIPANNALVHDRGLIDKGNEHPLRSNCLVNLLMISFDTLRNGYTPYDAEFAHLIRHEQYDREEWRELFETSFRAIDDGTFERESIDLVLDRVGLRYERGENPRLEAAGG